MPEEQQDMRRLSDEELVKRYREMKTAHGGDDLRFIPPDDDRRGELEAELERRGLAPDREDLIPTTETDEDEPVVRDRA